MRRVVLRVLLLLCACGPRPPYFPESEFWQELPANPELDPDSDAYIADLLRSSHGGRISVNTDQYNVPVVWATPDTPRRDVPLVHPAFRSVLRDVPIPAWAEPAAGTDGHLVIIDAQTRSSYEFWQARKNGDRWEAASGVRFDLRGDGINRAGSGVRATSLSLLLGLLTYDELRSKRPIEHALAWAFDAPNARFYTPPAASSDGNKAGRLGSVPAGARLQLDPTLDVTTLGLSPVGVRIARAMQRYGLFCVDTSADGSIVAESLRGTGQSYAGLLSWDETHRIPVSRLRVLRIRQKIPIP